MSWLSSLLVALLAGIAGLFLAGFIANACVSWYQISSREGQSGYYVIFTALGGGIASLLVGLLAARVTAAIYGAGFAKELGAALACVLVVAGAAALLARLCADVPPELDGRDLVLEVEFRFPNTVDTSSVPTTQGEWAFVVHSAGSASGEKGKIHDAAARLEHGRWIVPASLPLFTEKGKLTVSLAPANTKEVFGFLLPLPARPGRESLEWSAWLPRQQADGTPWPADKMSCRYRVQKTQPAPEPPSREQIEAKQASEAEAEFAAIPQDAPLETWFRYTRYEQPLTEKALQTITARPHFVAELKRLLVDPDAQKAHAAMICVSRLKEPPGELVPALEAAGRQIAANIETFNQTPKEQDPDFATAVDPATRFYGWIPAAENLRKHCGADLTKELALILELSRKRPESHCMRVDICRVASHYLHAWAKVPPLPTDPEL